MVGICPMHGLQMTSRIEFDKGRSALACPMCAKVSEPRIIAPSNHIPDQAEYFRDPVTVEFMTFEDCHKIEIIVEFGP